MSEGETVQSLNNALPVEFLEELWELGATCNAELAAVFASGCSELPVEEHRRLMRGKRGELLRRLFECDSRSGAYELRAAGALALVLKELGLVDDAPRGWRDVSTGKRVQTRLRELGRLRRDWSSDENRAWLRESWPTAVAIPLDGLKQWVRENNPNVRRDDDAN